jgi:hypothetical protein
MSAKHDLKHSIIHTLKHNQDGSFNTRSGRKRRLLLIADELAEAGFKIRHIRQLKFKHVTFLVDKWLKKPLDTGTIKNRMTDLRCVVGKFGKSDMIPAKNSALNIPNRQYITNKDKSIVLSEGDLSNITDDNVKMSLLLQRVFGLRREESIKIRINQAVFGNELRLKGSWCKNGKPRTINIIYPEQWEALEHVKKFIGKSQRALIPHHKSYIQQRNTYDYQVNRVGISRAHGLRHAYAQKRYFDLTGGLCPVKGGPTRKMLNAEQYKIDKLARQIISRDLGHERLEVVGVYLGK